MDEFTVPACSWAVFPGHGTNQSLVELQQRIVQEWLPTSGYEWAQAPDVEVYFNADPADMVFEAWLPVKKTMA
jgi:AraC family transcriptional regulator